MAKAPASARPAGASTFSMLGSDTAITGNIEASADLHIDGRVEGDVACSALVQGESSEITGAIRAETVRIAGAVHGTIAAREVVILRTARIEGDVAYDTLTVEQGARLQGRLSPNGGQTPPAIAQLPKSHEAELVLAE
ncbi:polymer-forming cytoskeletal protein [Novosphingobium sp. CF614]|uniref:bactofilin family protein n=1 Tax=Novosphingobium sp. CF614 TaxID=1884364 RepID=UPI000B89C31A|nr:polymer-forming cytoskeletal protein [Novosphingobium sp. CF614]